MAWQPRMVVASLTGKSCRSFPATRAGCLPPVMDERLAGGEIRRLPLFSQFPPATLFAAIRRGALPGPRRSQGR